MPCEQQAQQRQQSSGEIQLELATDLVAALLFQGYDREELERQINLKVSFLRGGARVFNSALPE